MMQLWADYLDQLRSASSSINQSVYATSKFLNSTST